MAEDFSNIIDIYRKQEHQQFIVRQSTAKERLNWLNNLKKSILLREEEIKTALYQDFRKHPIEVETTEILAVLLELKDFTKNLTKWMKTKKVGSSLLFATVKGSLQYEPKGKTLIITPWNYPFQLPIAHLIASISAGNTVILKLSEFSPNINKVIIDIINDTFNENHVAVVEGDSKVTTELLKLKFDHIHFTGSPAVGKIIMKAASQHLSDITLELGGKSPVFIDRKIDVKRVVKNLLWAKFVNAGQTCIAPDYALVDISLKETFEKTIQEEIKNIYDTKNPTASPLASVISQKHFFRLKEAIEEANDLGCNWIVNGLFDSQRNFITPHITSDIPVDSVLMQEEIFGPILPIIYYSTTDEALQIVSQKEKPLALYIFSKDKTYINTILKNTTAGGVTINDAMVHILHPNLPFGGINNSGIGQSFGQYGFKSFSHEKAIAEAKIIPMTKLFWFPYTKKTQKLLHYIKTFFT